LSQASLNGPMRPSPLKTSFSGRPFSKVYKSVRLPSFLLPGALILARNPRIFFSLTPKRVTGEKFISPTTTFMLSLLYSKYIFSTFSASESSIFRSVTKFSFMLPLRFIFKFWSTRLLSVNMLDILYEMTLLPSRARPSLSSRAETRGANNAETSAKTAVINIIAFRIDTFILYTYRFYN